MARVIERTVFQFDELSDSAKERAREWFRNCDDGNYLDSTISDFASIAEIIGLDLSMRSVPLMNGMSRQEPCVYYSVAHCQSDYAAFEGTWTYKAGCLKAIKEYAPQDIKLHTIVSDWQLLNKRFFYQLQANCRESRNRQYTSEVIRKGCARYDEQAVDYETEKEAAEIAYRLADWLYKQMRDEVEYQNSDEQVDESIRANEYEFDESGEIA